MADINGSQKFATLPKTEFHYIELILRKDERTSSRQPKIPNVGGMSMLLELRSKMLDFSQAGKIDDIQGRPCKLLEFLQTAGEYIAVHR